MSQVDVQGLWWEESTSQGSSGDSVPEDAVPGSLSFKHGIGGKLEFIGVLPSGGNLPTQEEPVSSPPDRIYGLAPNGKQYTLERIQPPESTMGAAFSTETYTVGRVYEGGFVGSETRFWKMSLSLQHLANWAEVKYMQDTIEAGQFAEVRTEDVELDDAELILWMYRNPRTGTRSARFEIYPNSPNSYSKFVDNYSLVLARLLTLGTDETVFPSSTRVFTGKYGHSSTSLTVYENFSFYEEVKQEKHAIRMHFTLTDIEFRSAFSAWFEFYNDCPEFFHRYFGQIYNDQQYTPAKFLSIVVGLELYHRQTYTSGNYMSDEIWERVRDSTLDGMPNVVAKKRVQDLLNSIGNRYSLADRLRDISADHDRVLDQVFDVNSVVSETRDMRIDIAHGLDQEDLDKEEQYKRKKRAEAFATVCLLDTLNIDEAQSVEILNDMCEFYGFY